MAQTGLQFTLEGAGAPAGELVVVDFTHTEQLQDASSYQHPLHTRPRHLNL
ncbi:hypothetical protein [Aidingimonas halophila]|uniref:Uncharacterized protein n=1 Tax=Aidingimonas halophila TaxID=574349 RepID=A0A1H3EFF4_9GAMM|nr:hypothetical protein [Aidingimonas halophila]GHC33462.1 hypothetical protein GCM10008094_27810 [Aidingimonas halophila]SDX77473.1 hypothetical protein SAMN05443545_107112 [Aidingimonas halophila]